jgi:hypothetical protein
MPAEHVAHLRRDEHQQAGESRHRDANRLACPKSQYTPAAQRQKHGASQQRREQKEGWYPACQEIHHYVLAHSL